MRKLFWTLAGLSLPAVVILVPRAGAEPPAPAAVSAALRPAPMPALPPPSPFEVKAQHGTWMICAAVYTGTEAGYLADQVVKHLRKQNVNSFVFNYADRERRELEWAYHQRMKLNPNVPYRPRFTTVETQVAVLIGGFKTIEDARSALPAVRNLPPPKVTFRSGEDASDRLVIFGEKRDERTDLPETRPTEGHFVNPFARCLVIRNPAAPKQQAQKNEDDPIWKELNKHEPYSLLKNRKNYTLVVKVYAAPTSYQSGEMAGNKNDSFLGKIGLKTSGPEALQATAMQAHELARFLRQYNLETYVLHTRQSSIVTVGGFASLEDEELRAAQQKLSSMRLSGGQNIINGGSLDPNQDPLALMPNPMPMRVPKL